MPQISNKNASEICPQTVAKNDPKMEPIWMPNGAKMEAKRHPKINVFFDGFPKASGNIDLFATGPRRIRDESATVAASVTLSPADPPGRRHIIKEYYTKTSKDSIACRI